MNSGSTRQQTTTQNTVTDPWAPAQPALQKVLAGATAAYDSGVGSQVYGGERVAGLGSDTLAGLGGMKMGAAAGSGTAAAGNGYLRGLLGDGGTTGGTRAATAGLAGIDPRTDTAGVASAAGRLSDPDSTARTTGAALAGGAYATDATPLAGMADGLATGGTQTQRSLQDVADGKYLSGGNPYLDKIVNRSANEAASAVAQKMAASGRYGSGRYQGAIAEAVGNTEANLRYQDYGTERDRQASAASAIDGATNARAGAASSLYQGLAGIRQGNAGLATTGANMEMGADQAALSGASALASLTGQNADRALSQGNTLLTAAQGDRAAGLAGIAATPTAQSALAQPGQTLAQVGAIQDAARQERVTADQTVFDEQQAAPWKQVGLLAQLATPVAGLGGTSSGTTVQRLQENPGLLNSIIGGISGLTGSAANLGRAAPFFAMLSDERAKENIQPVGALNDGQTVYSYRYKGDPTPQIGLLAQEVAHNSPDAVAVLPGSAGLMGVDYGRATARSAEMAQRYRGLAAMGA